MKASITVNNLVRKVKSWRKKNFAVGKKKAKTVDGFLIILASSLLIIILFVLSLINTIEIEKIVNQTPVPAAKNSGISKTYTPIPIIVNSMLTPPIVSAQAVLAIDVDSMVPLFEKNPDVTLLPASTTKIMTALVALDYYPDDQIITVMNPNVGGQKMGLIAGEKIFAGDLIESLLVYSANDAAEVLAQDYPGGRDAFIAKMNEKATELNLHNTHFENPVGFDGTRHFSTARDLVRVSLVALKNPEFARIVKIPQLEIASVDFTIKHKLTNTNKLLGEVDGVLGVKTGWTENARENLVTYVERGGRRVLIAAMGSQDRFGETKEIIDWIFSNYQWKEVVYRFDNF